MAMKISFYDMGIRGVLMSDKNTITMLNEKFENDKTGEKVEGITIIVDGKLKQIFDTIMLKNDSYNNYTEILRDALFDGITSLIDKSKN